MTRRIISFATAVITAMFISGLGNADARNGKLELTLKGENVKVARVVVSDNSGMKLGPEGNSVSASLKKEQSLIKGVPVQISLKAPKGAFSKGCTVKIFDAEGNAVAFKTLTGNCAEISGRKAVSVEISGINAVNAESAEVSARGYYKDLLMDSSVYLSQRDTLYAADQMGWKYDFVMTRDSLLMLEYLVTSDKDLNGCLIYPDGEPRYRMMYVNGGLAASHGEYFGETGREQVRTFIRNGGSYVGSCAGALLAGTGTDRRSVVKVYFGIFPGITIFTDLKRAFTPLSIPEDSPLLKYYDFGGDHLVDSILHNGGDFCADTTIARIKGAEVLARFVAPGKPYDKQACIWAYKDNDVMGRVVPCGSHPEINQEGERIDLMKAMCRYAVDGNGITQVKAELVNGQERIMDQLSSAAKPEYARIGDKQYHHYKIVVPAGAKSLKITLKADDAYDLSLSVRKGGFAWRTDSPYVLAQDGATKTLELSDPEAGEWYISVYCATCGTTTCAKNVFTYNGDTSVLNGIPYVIKADWK